MNLAGFEKYDAALGKDEVDQIEKLMVEQITSMTGQRLESVKLYHMRRSVFERKNDKVLFFPMKRQSSSSYNSKNRGKKKDKEGTKQ